MPGDVSLSGIEFTIKGKTDNATNSIDKLISKLSALNDALSMDNGLSKLKSNLTGLKKALDEIKNADIKGAVKNLKHLGELGDSLQGLANISKDIASFARAMAKLAENPEKLIDVANGLRVIGSVDLSNLVAASDALRAFADAMKAVSGKQSAPAEESISGWKRLGAAIGSVAKSAARGVGKIFAFPFKGAIKGVSGFAKKLTDVAGSFKRILGYRIVRAILKEIVQAFGEGVKNLYGWSSLVGGKFAASMNQISTSLLYFKNSLGAAVAPIVNALAPAIDFLIDKIVALINVINQLFAKLTGASSWTAAKKKATEYGEAVGGAGGKAKEALRYLAPFDELNRLPDENKGGGGGGSEDDYGDMFEERTEFLEGIGDFAQGIRDAIEQADWQGLGTLLGDKINELISKVDWAGLGVKVGGYIGAWFSTKYWTLKETDFTAIGASIATFLSNMLAQINFEDIGSGFVRKFTAIGDMIIGAINTIDWSVVGKSIGDYLRGVFNEAASWLNGVDWATTVSSLINGLIEAVKGFDISGVINSFAGALSGLANAISQVDWGQAVRDVFSLIGTVLSEIDLSSLIASVASIAGAVLGAVIDVAGTVITDLIEFVKNPDTWTLIKAWFSDLPAKIKNVGIKVINAFKGAIQSGINSLIAKYNESSISDIFGKIEPIEFEMLPEIPTEELNKNYDAAKKQIEARNAADKISLTGDITQVDQNLKEMPSIKSKANFTSRVNNLSDTEKQFNTVAKFTSRKNELSDKEKRFSTVANFTSRENGLSDKEKRFSTVANFNSRVNGLSDKEKQFSTVANFNSYLNGLGTPTLSATANLNEAKVDSKLTGSGKPQIDVLAKITGTTDTGGAFANGGAYYGGSWHSIPQYANGGRAHGSIFWAGEAGAELVGHVGGRTEVLNQSQLAATMYAAVSSALHGLHMVISAPSASGSMSDSMMDEETMYRAFSRALADSDLGGDIELDGNTLYRAMVNRNRQNTRLTGVNAMA